MISIKEGRKARIAIHRITFWPLLNHEVNWRENCYLGDVDGGSDVYIVYG